MIGIVIVTHGRLAEEFIHAAEHVVGPQKDMAPICIGADDEMETRRQDILNAVNACDSGSGVIILTDMFGGTPSNLSISTMKRGGVEVVAGVNLPMLIKLAEVRSKVQLDQAALMAQEAGRKYISVASAVLAGGA